MSSHNQLPKPEAGGWSRTTPRAWWPCFVETLAATPPLHACSLYARAMHECSTCLMEVESQESDVFYKD